MRRNERELMDKEQLHDIIKQCLAFRLGLCKNNVPYVVPLSFGFDGTHIYFHCASEGKKLDYLSANKQVCFEFDTDIAIKTHDKKPCSWGMIFKSVIGQGTAEELTQTDDKINALNHIMAHYSDQSWEFPETALQSTSVWRINIEKISGKQA